jgi:hypothetical protein
MEGMNFKRAAPQLTKVTRLDSSGNGKSPDKVSGFIFDSLVYGLRF